MGLITLTELLRVSFSVGKVNETKQFSDVNIGKVLVLPVQKEFVISISLDLPLIIFSAPDERPLIEIFQSTALVNLALKKIG